MSTREKIGQTAGKQDPENTKQRAISDDAASAELTPTSAEVSPRADDGLHIAPVTGLGGGSAPPTDKSTVQDETPDPFNPDRLRLSQDFGANLGVRKALLVVPVRKPLKETWVRTHPDEKHRLHTLVLELKNERETFLVAPEIMPELATESTVSPRMIFPTIDREGTVFLWPVRLPGADGKIDDWNRSALEAAIMASTQWVRVAANMNLGAYDVFTTTAQLPEPTWPETSLRDLLKVAFKDHMIDSMDHPVLRRLRGEA